MMPCRHPQAVSSTEDEEALAVERVLYFWMRERRSLALMDDTSGELRDDVPSDDPASSTAAIIFARAGVLFRSLAFWADTRMLYRESLESSDSWPPDRRSVMELPESDESSLSELRSDASSAFESSEIVTVSVVPESVDSVRVLALSVDDSPWEPRRLESRELMLLTLDIWHPPVSHVSEDRGNQSITI
jgi:hypothetical protein